MPNPTVTPRVHHVIRGLKAPKGEAQRDTKERLRNRVETCLQDKQQQLQQLGLQEVVAARLSRQPGHKVGEFIGATHRPPLPSQQISLEASDTESTPGP